MAEEKNILDVTKRSEIFGRTISAREIIRRVMEFLILRATKTGMEQNENNKLTFSNVSFWFNNVRDKNKNVIKSELIFSTLPEIWDFERILMYIEEYERAHMMEIGVDITGIDYVNSNTNNVKN